MADRITELLERAQLAGKENRFDDAKSALTEVIEAYRESDPPPESLAIALRMLGEVERRLGDSGGARSAYEEAVSLMRQCADQRLLAHTLRHLGQVYQEQNEAELARACLNEALEIYRAQERSHPAELANAVRAVAVDLHDAGEHGEAEPLWCEACGLYRSIGLAEGVAECCVRLALIARHRGDTEAARSHLDAAEAAAQESGEAETLAYVASAVAESE